MIVSQLHRSPGVVFEEATHPNGQRLISARIIPFRGSWVEFTVDIHDVIYVHIDKKKKFPATALLRAFGYGSNSDILRLFFAVRELDLTKKRESRTDVREVIGAIIAEDIELPGESHGRGRAQGRRTKKARAERERAENVLLVERGRRTHGGGVQPPSPPEHPQGQGVRRRTWRSTCATSRKPSSAASARCAASSPWTWSTKTAR